MKAESTAELPETFYEEEEPRIYIPPMEETSL